VIERRQSVKALILVIGRGNCINEFSKNRNKCMVFLKGQPLLEHALSRVAEEAPSGIKPLRTSTISASGMNKGIWYVIQKDQEGLLHTIRRINDDFEGENFFRRLEKRG
jgi:NDP-sugar pyrophosphorylase family protein